jgi:hypothetical protein
MWISCKHFERKEGEEATGGIAHGGFRGWLKRLKLKYWRLYSYLWVNRKRTRTSKLIANQ